MNTQEFDLNIIPDSAPVVVHVDQYDHGVGRLVASLYDDETPYAPEGASVYVQGTKPDGKFFVRSTGVSISGNVVTADLAEVMTQVAGRTRMQFVVTEPSGRTGTFVFWLDVQLSALPPDSEMSESDISMVEEAIEQMQELASDAAESAQEAAGFAQNSSDSAEDSEAWAVGTRNGEAVTPGDPTYHNNSKWYAEHGGGAGGGHTIVNSDGQDMPQRNALQFKGMKVTDDAINDMTIVEGGSGGSTIEVTTSESSLIGEDVTVSDGTNTWTSQFDNSGKAVFSGITSTGTLTISATDGSEPAQYILTAPYFGKYAVTLAFWSATINVTTTTTQLNGKTVYAKKNGVVMGSGVFSNGSASITIPEEGSYVLEVTLSWKTYQSYPINVTAETTYSATLNGFIAPISLSTPTSAFYGQDISVTCDGTAVPGTSFDDSGAASFTALQAGTYVFIVMYSGEPYTATVVVTSETSYSAVINMFTATINVTTPSSSLYGQTITIKKDGTQVGTAQFDNTGAASITVHDTGSYVFEATYDGYTFASAPVNVSAEATYSATITAFTATLNISTSSPALYEQTITIKKGTTTVETTTFSASGTASFNVHETGEYTLECGGYSSSVTVSAETSYSVTISAGLDLSAWITAGSTTDYPLNPSSYADFAALEADEEVIRQLMLVHNAVDYLATADANDPLIEDVINSDICAKWISLSDYAMDKLEANANIKAVMDEADKYGYGEWGIVDSTTTPPTWGALGNVPVMTANNAPYGVASMSPSTLYDSGLEAYKAFDGNATTFACPVVGSGDCRFIYQSLNPINVKKAYILHDTNANNSATYKVQGSNDGITWTDISDAYTINNGEEIDRTVECNNDDYYLYHAVYFSNYTYHTLDNKNICYMHTLQFYGRELKPLVPTMTSNTTPKGEASASRTLSGYPAWWAFDGIRSSSSAEKCWIAGAGVSNDYLRYHFAEPTVCKMAMIGNYRNTGNNVNSFEIQGSNDGTDFSNVLYSGNNPSTASATTYYPCNNNDVFSYLQILCKSIHNASTNLSIDEVQFFGMDYSEKEFAQGSTRKTIYDHGIELETLTGTSGVEKSNDNIYIPAANGISTPSIDMTPFNMVGVVVGKKILVSSSGSYIGIGTETAGQANAASYSSGFSRIAGQDMPYNVAHDISSMSESKSVTITSATGVSDYLTIDEIWLE